MNHLHTQGEGTFCEVSFCTCNVEKGQKICTCHHPELQHKHHSDESAANHHSSSSDTKADFCYFSTSHSDGSAESPVVIEFNKFNAIDIPSASLNYSLESEPITNTRYSALRTGVPDDLFKPPRTA